MRARNTLGARAGATIKARGTPILRDWLALTWFTDSTPVFGLRRALWNWILLATTAVAGYLAGAKAPLVIAAVLAVGVVVTLGRAMRVMPARRRFVDALIEDTRQIAGHPRSTTSAPVAAASRVKVSRWGRKNRPAAIDITISKTAPAAPPLARGLLEKAIDQIPNPHSETGGGWVYSTNPKTGQLHADAVPGDDERLHHQREIAFLRTKFTDWFKITPKQLVADHYDLQVTEWTTREHPVEGPVPVPAGIRFSYGSHNVAAQDVRDSIERACDAEYIRGVEWIYTWSDGTLEIAGVDNDSVDAKRKRSARWVADLVAGQAKAARTKDSVASQVTGWQEEVHGDPWVPIAFTADFGSGAFTTGPTQRAVETVIDDAMAASAAGLVWVYEWTVGAATRVESKAFPANHVAALRKTELKRLRSVVEQKFGGRRNDVNVEVLTWQPTDDEAPVALPAQVEVRFGALDVSKPETTDAFEQHYDGLYTACDWHYDWRSAEGRVVLTSVPRLAKAIPFPENGTPLFNEMIEGFRDGKIFIGPQKGGGTFYWDLNKCAHGLIGGRTGAGKSVALDIILFLTLWCRDVAEIIVCDPKRTDFTWTPEFPSVIRFAAGAIEIADAVGYVRAEMDRRQTILNKRGCRNLRYLRKLYAEHPEFEAEDGPAPKRLILFFDELANFWMKSDNEDIEAMKVTARSQMEELGQLARALEINMIIAAQKPDKDRMSTQLKEMCEFRLCVGPVNEYTSKQILDSNHGTRFPEEGTPKGRAWATTSELGFQVVQVPYLPNATEQCPWDPSLTITGSKDRLRAQLAEQGYQQVMVPNSDGGREPRWVLTDEPAAPAVELEKPAAAAPVDVPEPLTPAPAPPAPPAAPEPVLVTTGTSDDWEDEW
ncbi:FtsK/SpoIIIE domain-containing protein [Prescottella agglutinans]|uniref:S-DNA-T family DNA segregation ATPase FtsK/SpoIIIE n=1 Tax=Prescottella agglutinans TaxID=1644129 RepID=A0ABT6MJ34_9NOCA|nr:FtsK/SpoIIIE domain-containing protein [Prescottella agglutinans]MDH6284302.1 S-DNA-T family DNA segregation ATPase FtsK/SpoIIIE [Prescottella agglutinans]